MSRYVPSRQYFWAGFVAWGLAVFSGWVSLQWPPAVVAFGLFLLSSVLMIFLALRPAIEIRDTHLVIGRRAIPWNQIRRVDRTSWLSPLVVKLTLLDESRIMVIYPGDLDSSHSLLRHLRRMSREALIDGIPYRRFWSDQLPAGPDRKSLPSPRYRVLRPEDEEEVERLYQKLKTVGRLDPKNSAEEK